MSARMRFLAVAAAVAALALVFFALVRGPEEASSPAGEPDGRAQGNPLEGGLGGSEAGGENPGGREDPGASPGDQIAEPTTPQADAAGGDPAREPVRGPVGAPDGSPAAEEDGTGGGPPPERGDDAADPPDPLGVADDRESEGVYNGARLSASNFVTYAYGYTGEDREQYLRGVEQAVLVPEFYESAGGAAVKRTADLVGSEGVRQAAVLEDFHSLPGKPEDEGILYADVRFSVGEAWAPPAEWKGGEPSLAGQARTFEQRIAMTPAGGQTAAWKVFRAEAVRAVP